MIAICVIVGTASLKSVLISGFSPFASSVQTPLGPLKLKVNQIKFYSFENNLVFIILYLKSGIPAEVLMPAPVCITTCFASFIHFVRRDTLAVTRDLLSNFLQPKEKKKHVVNN